MIVPMDHGYTYGPIKGLKNMPFVVDQVCQGGASAVLVHKGLVRSLTNVIPPQSRINGACIWIYDIIAKYQL